MKSDAVRSYWTAAEVPASDVDAAAKSPCTTASSVGKVDPGIPPTSLASAVMEFVDATAGWNLTPWQRQLLDGMYAHGKTQPKLQFILCIPRQYS